MLKILAEQGDPNLATVVIAELDDGSRIEFVESVQPPIPRDQKWVLIVSTLKGCPVSCPICDAGSHYKGKLSAQEIMAQIDYLIRKNFPKGTIPVPKLKIQFARMGDPMFNDAVLEVLEELPKCYDMPGLMPCISTVAPKSRRPWLDKLREIKTRLYSDGRFQMQFSLHTTDEQLRQKVVPTRTLSFSEMAAFGKTFFQPGDRKITLNFATAVGMPLDPGALVKIFSPRIFMIKLTPINPTGAAEKSGMKPLIDPDDPDQCEKIVASFKNVGFDTLLSIGELDENRIGSNCGMFLSRLS